MEFLIYLLGTKENNWWRHIVHPNCTKPTALSVYAFTQLLDKLIEISFKCINLTALFIDFVFHALASQLVFLTVQWLGKLDSATTFGKLLNLVVLTWLQFLYIFFEAPRINGNVLFSNLKFPGKDFASICLFLSGYT